MADPLLGILVLKTLVLRGPPGILYSLEGRVVVALGPVLLLVRGALLAVDADLSLFRRALVGAEGIVSAVVALFLVVWLGRPHLPGVLP